MHKAKVYKRKNGKFGIRNHLLVLFTVECAHQSARRIAEKADAKLMGFPGCDENDAAYNTLYRLGTHQNVGAVLIVSLGCESTNFNKLKDDIANSGKPTELLVIQQSGGSISAVKKGVKICQELREKMEERPAGDKSDFSPSELVIGVECGGSDATSGLIANPAVGLAVDRIIDEGGTVIAEELTELLGCQEALKERCASEEVSDKVVKKLNKAQRYSNLIERFAISSGNKEGGLTTIEEKSFGAMFKLGSRDIKGVLDYSEVPPEEGGIYLLDTTSSAKSRVVGMRNGGDAEGVTQLVASGAHAVVFTTGRGTPVGNAIVPVIKVCGNPNTCESMAENIDVRLDGFFDDDIDPEEAGSMVYRAVGSAINGQSTKSEKHNHEEFWISYHF